MFPGVVNLWLYETPIERKFNDNQYSHYKHGLENISSEDIRPRIISCDNLEKDICSSTLQYPFYLQISI